MSLGSILAAVGLSDDDLDLLKVNKLLFVTRLVAALDRHVPYQTLSQTTSNTGGQSRCHASVDENVGAVMSGVGGAGWTLNSAVYRLLQQAGFTVRAILAKDHTHSASADSHLHMLAVIKNVNKRGDRYLVDVGFRNASHPPVALDFKHESPIYSFYHHRVKWTKAGNMYTRKELVNSSLGKVPETCEGNWGVALTFTLKSYKLEEVENVLFPPNTRLLNVVAEPVTRMLAQYNYEMKKYVLLNDMTGYVVGDDRQSETMVLQSLHELHQFVARFFPHFPGIIVKSSYEAYLSQSGNGMKGMRQGEEEMMFDDGFQLNIRSEKVVGTTEIQPLQ